MKLSVRGFMVLLSFWLFTASAFAGHTITAWPENKKGAVSITFDDGYPSQYTLGVPALNARGMKGTFFIITDDEGIPLSTSAWNSWRNVAISGHEIGGHTLSHPDLTSLSSTQVQIELSESKAEIDAQITSQKCLTFAYPFGALNPDVESITRNYFIAARGITCQINSEPFDFYNVNACTPEGEDIYVQTDAAELQGKWLVAYFHSLVGAEEVDWGTYDIDMFTTYLDYLKRKNLWVGTFGAAVKYIRERSTATLSVVSSASDQIVLNLADTLDDVTYNQPLTIRSDVPSTWRNVIVQQGSSSTEVTSALVGTTRVIYYNAIPDRGLITLRDPLSVSPQISTLAPQFVTAGSLAFTVTVSGSKFVSGSKVRWNGSDRATTFVSATQLKGDILAADLVTPGTIPVTVINPDGRLSNAMTFEIRSPLPTVTDLSPAWGTSGGPSFTLIVHGSNFISGSKVRWRGSDRSTSFIHGGELQATISAADIATAGVAGVTVYNPPPGGGTSNAINFDIFPVFTSLTVSPSSVVGGNSSTGTVALSGAALSGGATVMLSSNNPAATVPANVQVAGGATSATFTITTTPVSGATAVNISGSYGGVTKSSNLTVNPITLSSLSLSPSSVTGGNTSTGTVTLNGPAPGGGASVTLSSSNTAVAPVPAAVTVPEGATSVTFTVTTTPVSGATVVNISGSYGGVTRSSNLTVNLASLSSLSLIPSSVVGGSSSTGTVTLNGPAPGGGAPVTLSSSNTTVAPVPSTVTVPEGATSATFTITTTPVSRSTAVSVSGSYGGVTRSASLTVGLTSLSTLSLVPSTLVGGSSSIGTVTLNGPAPTGGAVVSLSSNNTSVAKVPSTVAVPAGSASATFTITTSKVTYSRNVSISGNYGGVKKTATLVVTVNAPGPDTAPPYVDTRSPASGATGVSRSNRTVSFHVKDSLSGVLQSSITANIEGTNYTCSSSGVVCSGSSSDITFTYTNGSDWSYSQQVDVTVNAGDVAGNAMTADSWYYTIENVPTPGLLITHVQSAGGSKYDAGHTTHAKAYTTSVTRGNILIAFFALGTPKSITSTCSNTFTAITTLGDITAYYAFATSSGSCTVTANHSSQTWTSLWVSEFANVHATSPIDSSAYVKNKVGSSSLDGNTVGPMTTKYDGSMIVAQILNMPGTWPSVSPGTNYTEVVKYSATANPEADGEIRLQTSAGSISATWTCGNTDNYSATMIGLRRASTP